MPSSSAWTCLLAALPLLTAEAAQAELPGGDSAAFRPQMTARSTERTEPPSRPAPQPSATPLKLPRLSSRYGYRQHPIDGEHRFHAGIDIPGATGSPVLASAAGVVRFAGSAGGYGRMVEIDHGSGLRTRYAHLAEIAVAPGARVTVGATVGRMGSSGRSTGTHLHFEVRRDGRAVDPLAYLSQAPLRPLPSSRRWEAEVPHVSSFARARAQARLSADGE